MWYLIIPPIIVVVSLLFVLGYLSRRGADPSIAEKASQSEETEKRVPFLRTKNFLLGILEKTAYRFKVRSLQMHNALNNWTQAIKERRRNFQAKILTKPAAQQQPSERPGFFRRWSRKDTETAGTLQPEERGVFPRKRIVRTAGEEAEIPAEAPADVARPFLRVPQRRESPERNSFAAAENPAPLTRSMVSETMAHPETTRRGIRENISREEDLVARIAANPKDFTAYESLGDYYLEMNNVKDAKECYRQVLKLSPVQRMVKIKIRRLEKILSQKTQ